MAASVIVKTVDRTTTPMGHTPGGAQTISKSKAVLPKVFPDFVESGLGASVKTPWGMSYCDWVCGLGAVGLGYRFPAVDRAAVEQIGRGVSFSLPTFLEEDVAAALCVLYPAEAVRFVKTGSEACSAAVRIARTATGRDRIVVCGYHGWHDWYVASRPMCPGVPKPLRKLVRTFTYNNLTSLALALDDTVAAVMMEPVLHDPPAEGFLEGVQRLAHKAGALFILDETVTGFRCHRGGATARYGLSPDLIVLGKALGNGWPIAAVLGKWDVMREGAIPISGTFGGEAVSLAVARVVIRTYQDQDVCGYIERIGQTAMDGLRTVLPSGYMVDGMPWKPRVHHPDPETHYRWIQNMVFNRHLIHPLGMFVSFSHTVAHVESLAVAAIQAAGPKAPKLLGEIPSPPFALRT